MDVLQERLHAVGRRLLVGVHARSRLRQRGEATHASGVPAERRALADGNDRRSLGCETADDLVERELYVGAVGAVHGDGAPRSVAGGLLPVAALVRYLYRTLDDEHEVATGGRDVVLEDVVRHIATGTHDGLVILEIEEVDYDVRDVERGRGLGIESGPVVRERARRSSRADREPCGRQRRDSCDRTERSCGVDGLDGPSRKVLEQAQQ